MPCYHPLKAFRVADQNGFRVVFDDRGFSQRGRPLDLPCGQCFGCRLERSRQWAIRCMHEAQMHESNCFITLTYKDECLPDDHSLHYEAFQKFMKRLRRKVGAVRFLMCGEYGEQYGRPHFHACIFGYDFPDKVHHVNLPSGSRLYRSDELSALWPYGFASVGAVTFESAAYVARYSMKKVKSVGMSALGMAEKYTYVLPTGEIISRRPEFGHMSLKPGIGASWFEKFKTDVFPGGKVVARGVESQAPRYYDKLLERLSPEEYDNMAMGRFVETLGREADNTPERLAVRETVAKARVRSLKRTLT